MKSLVIVMNWDCGWQGLEEKREELVTTEWVQFRTMKYSRNGYTIIHVSPNAHEHPETVKIANLMVHLFYSHYQNVTEIIFWVGFGKVRIFSMSELAWEHLLSSQDEGQAG